MRHLMLIVLVFTTAAQAATAAEDAKVKVDAKPYVEVTGVLGMDSSLVELKDGSLLTNGGAGSVDGGKTWSEPRSFGEGVAGNSIMRLNSGSLALTSGQYQTGKMWVSRDEGLTWEPRGVVKTPEPKGGLVADFYDPVIQLKSGRLLYPWDMDVISGNLVGMTYAGMTARGEWKGKTYDIEGHNHIPEFYTGGVSYSDDEGKTWTYDTTYGCPNTMMGWFDFKGEVNGMAGCTPFGEGTMAECKDGRIIWIGRSTVGRILYTYSGDQGRTWDPLRPSELASSGSPPRLRRIPKTGDLMCVWNQVSRDETSRGYRRGRLSAAISTDCGATWSHFKAIELSDGLKDVARIPPQFPIKMSRAKQWCGKLADGYMYFHYANICFAGDRVYIMYSRGGPRLGIAEQMLEKQDQVLRIYSLDWFYK